MMRSHFVYGLAVSAFAFCLVGMPAVRAHAQAASPQPAPAAPAPAPVDPSAPAAATPDAAAPAPVEATPVEAAPAAPPPVQYTTQAADPETATSYPNDAPASAPRKRRSIGLMIAGLATLGASYGLTAAVGLQLASGEATNPGEYCTNCDSASLLFIPIVGPWAFLPEADGTDGKVLTAILGVAQATGLVLSIFGIAKFIESDPERTAQAAPRLMLGVAPTKTGAHASMHLRF